MFYYSVCERRVRKDGLVYMIMKNLNRNVQIVGAAAVETQTLCIYCVPNPKESS